MGIFGSKKKTYVSSVVYNLAGDEKDRPNYLKTAVLSSIINNRSSISEDIVGSYIEGPGMRFRNFAKWAKNTNYNNVIGLVTGSILTGNSLDDEVLLGELPVSPGYTPSLQNSRIAEADYSFWADQWVAENYPEKLLTPYVSGFSEQSNEIVITWDDESTDSFTPVNYDPRGTYLYAVYTETAEEIVEPEVEGDTHMLDDEEDFPDVSDWELISYEEDGYDSHGVWGRETYMGQAPDRDATYTLKETMYQDTVQVFPEDPEEEPEEGEEEEEPVEEPPVLERTWRIDTQVTYHSSRSPMKVFIYKYGSGNPTLDAMFAPSDTLGSFFPFIPFRLDNRFVSSTYLPTVYAQAKKGYKKATTGNFDKLIDNLADNEDLEDIDYAYCVFGVSLNVLENASRKYIYQFFKEIMNDFPVGGSGYSAWQAAWNAAQLSWETWTRWSSAQADVNDPLYGTPEPTRLPYPQMPTNSIRISSGSNSVMNYDMTITWSMMEETTGTGLLKPNAKQDELWFTIGATQNYEEIIWGVDGGIWKPVPGNSISNDDITLNWQVTPTTWRRLRIVGLNHRNMIYGGKSVDITAKEALEDVDESGFIIPLHEGIYRQMGLKDGTQMATACSFMVFNCYQVVKKKWYQTGIFQIIVTISVIVISVYTGGVGASSAGGLLGSNVAVGTALGFAGTTALIVGAVANAIAAVLLMRVVTTAATTLFGDKWGALIGAIASVIAVQVGTAMARGQSMASSFGNLMRADNIMKLMDATERGIQGYVQAAASEMAREAQDVMESYKNEAKAIQQAWIDNIGTGRGIIDPLEITGIFGVTTESVDTFLQRTLMTGSDVADMSLSMLTNFVDMTLNTDLPI